MDDLVKLLQTLIDNGALIWAVALIAFWILVNNGKALLEGVSSFVAEQKRVDAEIRRTDSEVAQAAQRRRERAAKKQNAAPAQAALPPPGEQLMLPPATQTRARSRASARKL